MKTQYTWLLSVALLLMIGGCSQLTPEQKVEARQDREKMAEETISELLKENDDLQANLDSSAGYMVTNWAVTKVPVLGGGKGTGLIVDSKTNEKTYVNVSRYDIGGGLGTRKYNNLLVVQDQEVFDDLKMGVTQFEAGAEAAAGTSGAEASSSSLNKDYKLYVLLHSGGSATATARMLRMSVDKELTVQESQTSYPNAFANDTNISDYEKRVWEHKMPFMAQDVIDLGFDLPLPYGVSIIYAKIRQDLVLEDLKVGLNGEGATAVNFVNFHNSEALNDSVQLKADMWLFPFMNVYAVAGAIKGDAKINFTIDGDDYISQKGLDCSGFLKPPGCALAGRDLTVSLGAGSGDINGDSVSYDGYNVGLGTVLAGGYKEWFGALPITYVYSNIDIIDTTVETLTLSPRIGKTINLKGGGTFSPFVGATYLDVDMMLAGSISVPSGEIDKVDTIEYEIRQKNADKWNAMAGFNWDITKHWSWNFEAGFLGSRENIITGMTYRY